MTYRDAVFNGACGKISHQSFLAFHFSRFTPTSVPARILGEAPANSNLAWLGGSH